ncbi:MAG: hypothetical protein IT353_20690, partial [Gemmatimonadaceae bacterium]|nr:hypothetical protein [Gemmatimonadaceae bacterium]
MTAPALPRGTADTAHSLASRLAAEQSALRSRSTATVVLAAVAVLAVAAAIGAWMMSDGRWLTLPRLAPFVIWGAAAVVAVGVVQWLRMRDAQRLELPSLASAIEQEQQLRAGSLRGALEVGDSGTLGAHAARAVATKLSATTLAPQLGQQLARTLGYAGGAAVVGAALLSLTASTRDDGFAAIVHPLRAFRGTLLPALAFEKLPTSVPRGMPLTVRVHADGRTAVTITTQAAGEAQRDTVVSVDPKTGMASVALGPVRAPVTLQVNDGRAVPLAAVVAVDERGWIGDVGLFAYYPSYLGRTNETLDAVSPIRVPRGTRVRVSAVLRGGVRNVRLTTANANGTTPSVNIVAGAVRDSAKNAADGTPVSGDIVLDHDGAWTWHAAGAPQPSGEVFAPEVPDSLTFVVVPDKSPEVVIASPASDTAIGVEGVVPVIVRAGDDHGVGNVALSLWVERAKQSETAATASATASRASEKSTGAARERIDIGDPAAPYFEGGVTVGLNGRDLQPGDRIHVVAIATDDSPWRQQTNSAEVILRVPTLSEQRSMARSLADSLAARALQMAQEEKRLQQNTADASRSRDLKNGGRGEEQPGGSKTDGSKASMSFQAAEKARELARQQEQMSKKIDSLRQNAKELENRLKSAGALDTALSNRMRDIQKMLRDAMT